MTTRLRLNTPVVPILAGVALLLQLTDPGRVWTILLIVLGGAWLIGFLWARSLANTLSLTREMRFGWAQVGDHLQERFAITNTGLFPATWIEVEDHSDLPGYRADRATGVDAQSDNAWVTDGVCTRRGLYQLGGTTLHSADPFGIYSVTLDQPESLTLMVMPPVVPLPEIEVAPAGFSGEGRPHPHAAEQTVGAVGVRQYTAGDSLRLVHWPTTARRGDMYVRLFDGAPAADWWIVTDLERRTQVGEGWDSTEEHAVILSASLADRGLRARQAVGLIGNGKQLMWIPPAAGQHHIWNVLRALALIEPGDTSLAELLERVRPAIKQRASLMIVTASLDPNWLRALLPFTWLGIVPTILLLDPLSFGGSASAMPFAATLDDMGITNHVVTRDLLDRPEAHPGRGGQWEWRITPTGRAVPIRSPGDSAWRRLSQ